MTCCVMYSRVLTVSTWSWQRISLLSLVSPSVSLLYSWVFCTSPLSLLTF